jgi:hypothetical protein
MASTTSVMSRWVMAAVPGEVKQRACNKQKRPIRLVTRPTCLPLQSA